MKKLFKVVALLLVSAVAAVAIAGCTLSAGAGGSDSPIVGFWEENNAAYGQGFYFKSDGTWEWYVQDENTWYYIPGGKYTFASDTLTISECTMDSDMNGSFPCTMSGDTLTLAIDNPLSYTKTALPQGATLYTGN